MKNDYVHGAYHKELEKEIKRVLGDCKTIGLFISKKQATAIVAQKSRRGKMLKEEIIEYLKNLEKAFTID